jgi:enoyl-CoA hydratase
MAESESVRVIRLECGKANAIDEALLATLTSELDKAAAEEASAIVLTGYGKYFSAGLNLTELPSTREGMLAFAETFDRALLHLLQFPLPTVAAINGHTIAGGCVLACACDVRIGADSTYRVGVSEVDIGVVFPAAALAVVQNAVHPSRVTDVILGARLMSPNEAQKVGILHDVVRADRLMKVATDTAERLGAKPQPGFQLTKRALLADLVERIESRSLAAREKFVDMWFSDEVTKRREMLLKKK